MDVKASCQACMMISKSGQVRLPKSSSELVVLGAHLALPPLPNGLKEV